jgi:AraC-like DNA-binding protein
VPRLVSITTINRKAQRMKVTMTAHQQDRSSLMRFREHFAAVVTNVDLHLLTADCGPQNWEASRLGSALLTRMSVGGMSMRRGRAEVARGDEDGTLVFVTGGQVVLEGHDGDQIVARRGEAAFISHSAPVNLNAADRAQFIGIAVDAPQMDTLRRTSGNFGALRARSDAGLNALIAAMIGQTIDEAHLLDREDQPRFGQQMLGFLDMVLGHHRFGRPDDRLSDPRYLRMQDTIVQGASDPNLGVTQVADAANVSRRTANMIFARHGTTIAKVIADRRLQLALQSLGSIKATGKTVTAIALEAGFGDVSTFYRHLRLHEKMKGTLPA